MDSAGAAALQLGEELSSTPEDAASIAAREYAKDLHTALPGIIKAFDRVTQTAKVQLTIKRLWVDEEIGWRPLPDLVDCPVQFPRAGGFIMTFPVSANDECLVHFAERAIDNWWARGGVQEPSEFRLHDLSDGFVALGYSSKPAVAQVVGGAASDGVEIRTLDGTTVLKVDGQFVHVGASIGSQATFVAPAFLTALNTFLSALAVYLGPAGIKPIADPTNVLTPTILAAITAFGTAAGASQTVKARVL